jgi:hypothetical protein
MRIICICDDVLLPAPGGAAQRIKTLAKKIELQDNRKRNDNDSH